MGSLIPCAGVDRPPKIDAVASDMLAREGPAVLRPSGRASTAMVGVARAVPRTEIRIWAQDGAPTLSRRCSVRVRIPSRAEDRRATRRSIFRCRPQQVTSGRSTGSAAAAAHTPASHLRTHRGGYPLETARSRFSRSEGSVGRFREATPHGESATSRRGSARPGASRSMPAVHRLPRTR